MVRVGVMRRMCGCEGVNKFGLGSFDCSSVFWYLELCVGVWGLRRGGGGGGGEGELDWGGGIVGGRWLDVVCVGWECSSGVLEVGFGGLKLMCEGVWVMV